MARSLGRIMETISSGFELTDDAEVTIEANPGDLTPETLASLKSIGATRLSIGCRAWTTGLLKMLGRRHSADEALEAHSAAREAGFDKVNLDLIYGLPGQTLRQWQHTVESAAEAGPGHMSLYALTLEEGTPMEQWVRRGTLPEPDPTWQPTCMNWPASCLEAPGTSDMRFPTGVRRARESSQQGLLAEPPISRRRSGSTLSPWKPSVLDGEAAQGLHKAVGAVADKPAHTPTPTQCR